VAFDRSQRIAADDQTLARIFVAGVQSRINREILTNPHIGDHATIANVDDSLQTKALTHFYHLGRERFRIAIAEGAERGSDCDCVRFLKIADGSNAETQALTLVSGDAGLFTAQQVTEIVNHTYQIGRMLNSLMHRCSG
jgi:hypothetical protein